MKYEIHGKKFDFDQECGIFAPPGPMQAPQYAVMAPEVISQQLNSMTCEEAIQQLEGLKSVAETQVAWKETPRNPGFPILIEHGHQTSIDSVRKNVQNTLDVCNGLIKLLQE